METQQLQNFFTKNKTWLLAILILAVSIILSFSIKLQSGKEKTSPLPSGGVVQTSPKQPLSAEQAEINRQLAALEGNSAGIFAKAAETGGANPQDLPREVSALFTKTSKLDFQGVKRISVNSQAGFKVTFTSRETLADAHGDLSNTLLKNGWTFVSGGTTELASRLEYFKGANPRLAIEAEMRQPKGRNVAGFLIFLSSK